MSIHTYGERLKTTAVFYELIVSGICVIAAGDEKIKKKLEKHFTQKQGMSQSV